jgi:alpha-1,3-rhamnosyltransferase
MNLPLVTIAMPAYNHENYIEEAINSVIDQTYQNIEFIIINDGSSDTTGNPPQMTLNLKRE